MFADVQGNHRTDRAEPSVVTRHAIGELEQRIQHLQETIGLSGLRLGDDALEVAADQFDNLLHGPDIVAHDIGTPLLEPGSDHLDLLALEDLTLHSFSGGTFPGEYVEQVIGFRSVGGAET